MVTYIAEKERGDAERHRRVLAHSKVRLSECVQVMREGERSSSSCNLADALDLQDKHYPLLLKEVLIRDDGRGVDLDGA